MERCFNYSTFKGPVSVTNNQVLFSSFLKIGLSRRPTVGTSQLSPRGAARTPQRRKSMFTTKVAKAEDSSEKKNRAIESSTYEKSKDSGHKKKDHKNNEAESSIRAIRAFDAVAPIKSRCWGRCPECWLTTSNATRYLQHIGSECEDQAAQRAAGNALSNVVDAAKVANDSSEKKNRAIETSQDDVPATVQTPEPVLAQTCKNYTVHEDGRIEYCRASSFEKIDLRKKN